MTAEQVKIKEAMKRVEFLRDLGYAVIVWTPDELRGVDPARVEDRSIEIGWDIIKWEESYDE
jgi:hypothetical protein